MDIQIPSGGNLKESKEHGRKSLYHLRKYIYHQKQNVARNVKVKGTDGEDSNKEHVIGNLRCGYLQYSGMKHYCFVGSRICK